MKKAINIKSWKTGNVIFSYECEDNTIKKTVEEAVKQGVSLAYADLKDTDLSNTNLDYANLSYTDLSYTDLSNANLCNTNLRYSNLSYSSLRYVDLSSANLFNANLSYSDLSYADLSSANLCGTNLMHSNLSYSNLNYAYLPNANLYESNLIFTDLSNANLSYSSLNFVNINNTNLSNTILYRTCLDYSDLSAAILDNVNGLNDQCPKEGSFIGWKKCYYKLGIYIVKLEIPADAKRSSSTGKQCRCSKAKVLKIENLDGTKADTDKVCSWYNLSFEYKIGEIVEVLDFDERYWIECSRGIHFFMDRKDAVSF